ncbi:MAG: nuclear protein [Parcubacteria group bacterium]|nr:nuclear protein [Parcubacteria group bacterium]
MGTEHFSVALGLLAGATQLLGYYLYVKLTKQAGAGSWVMWAFGAFVDALSYAFVAEDWVKEVLPFTCSMACMIMVGYLFAKGRLDKPEKEDWLIFGLDTFITFLWLFTTALVANLLYQASTVLSFRPMARDILADKHKEHWLPWAVWSVAYALHLVVVLMRLNHLGELAFPVVHLGTHSLILVLVLYKKFQKT